MRHVLIAAVIVTACSSRSSRDLVDSDAGSGGTAGNGGSAADSGSGGKGSGGSGNTGATDGGAGDAPVASGPLAFDPNNLVLRAGGTSDVTLAFQPDPSFSGTLDVTLTVEAPTGAGADGIVTVEPTSFVLSSTVNRQTVSVQAAPSSTQGLYTVRADARPSAGSAPLSAELPVTIAGRPGDLDHSFGNGTGYIDFQPEGPCSAESVVALADGRFVITGQALTSNMLIARFNADGTPDTSFGPDGSGALIDPNRNFGRSEPVLLPDGSLLVAFDRGSIAIAHVLDDGTLDPNWGTGGVLDTTVMGSNHVAFGVDSEGRIVIGGRLYDETTNRTDTVLRRLTADGGLDTSFAGDGTLEISCGVLMGSGDETGYVEDLVFQDNGNIVVAGGCVLPGSTYADYRGYLLRVQSNGQPDSTFGPQGLRQTKFGTSEFGNFESGYSAAIQRQGDNVDKPILAGYFRQNADTAYLWSFVRHQVNGQPEPGASATFDVPTNPEDFPGRLLVQDDDRILSHIDSYQAANFIVLRFNADLTLDTTWGNAGVATPVVGRALGFAQSGDRLLVVGTAEPSPDNPQRARIARYWLR